MGFQKIKFNKKLVRVIDKTNSLNFKAEEVTSAFFVIDSGKYTQIIPSSL